MDYESILRDVPKSYDDFVMVTAGWMKRDEAIRKLVLDKIHMCPDSDSGDILEAICMYWGMTEPLELIDDEDEDEAEFSDKVMKVEPSEGIDDSQEERVSGRKGVRVAML